MSKFIELTWDGRKFFYDNETGAVIGENTSGGSFIGRITNDEYHFDETPAEIMAKIREGEGYEVKGELLQTGGVDVVKDLIRALEVNEGNICGHLFNAYCRQVGIK